MLRSLLLFSLHYYILFFAQAVNASYDLIETLNHDVSCFTQGLVYEGDYLYESCGLNGQSLVKKIHRETHKVLESTPLTHEVFAEGITYYQGHIFLLTYKNKKMYIINTEKMNIVGTKKITTTTNEGWGITHNHKHLIVSDGSDKLLFYDFPDLSTLTSSKSVTRSSNRILNKAYELVVRHHNTKNKSLNFLNELEYVNGFIYANVWYQDIIVKIDPDSGIIVNTYNLVHLYPHGTRRKGSDCLNGIAYDPLKDVFLITGKNWPFQYIMKFSNKSDILRTLDKDSL